jgi:hypothetical protein
MAAMNFIFIWHSPDHNVGNRYEGKFLWPTSHSDKENTILQRYLHARGRAVSCSPWCRRTRRHSHGTNFVQSASGEMRLLIPQASSRHAMTPPLSRRGHLFVIRGSAAAKGASGNGPGQPASRVSLHTDKLHHSGHAVLDGEKPQTCNGVAGDFNLRLVSASTNPAPSQPEPLNSVGPLSDRKIG